jgi:hypothetical protein
VINQDKVLDKTHSLLLVFLSFIWAGFCSVVSALATIGDMNERRRWKVIQVALVSISLMFLWAPFYLFEDKGEVEKRQGFSFDERSYTVNIPYRDPALNQYLGRTTNPLTQCQVYRGVTARTKKDAVAKALTRFQQSPESEQFSVASREGAQQARRRVEVMENLVIASEEN